MPIPRVAGIETEYGIARRSAATKELHEEQQPIRDTIRLIRSVATPVVWDYATERELPGLAEGHTVEEITNTVLTNGARFYEDHGHPEYATPECTTPLQVVLYDKAGERLLNLARMTANEAAGRDTDEIAICKNNADLAGHSFGCHENYLTERRTPWDRLREYLTPFLVTRQIFTGAGKVGIQDVDSSEWEPTAKPLVLGGKTGLERPLVCVTRDKEKDLELYQDREQPGCGPSQEQEERARCPRSQEEAVYQLSQRPDFFSTEEGLQTTFNRPLMNTRDEPHADPEQYRRLHVIVGDANLAPWATYLKIGTTMLVLDLIEDGFVTEEMLIRGPVPAFRAISRDQDWRWAVQFANSKQGTAIDHQELYLNKAKQHYATDPAKKEVIARWEYILDALRRQDVDALVDKLDHVLKRHIIEKAMQRHGWELTSPGVQKLDLRYHSVNPEESVYALLERRGYVDSLGITEAQIVDAVFDPPTDTRAYFRGTCIQTFGEAVVAANWDLLDVRRSNGTLVRIAMEDPFKGTAALAGDLLARAQDIDSLLRQV